LNTNKNNNWTSRFQNYKESLSEKRRRMEKAINQARNKKQPIKLDKSSEGLKNCP
jgi:hypothetical protein